MSDSKHAPEYNLIPMSKITDEARKIAVSWVENYEPMGFDLPGKQKLASDIMNYSKFENASLLSELEQLREENQVLEQHAGFNEEIQKQMQIRISDEMVRTFNRDQNITQLENLCRSKDMQIEKLMEEGKQSLLLYNSMTKNIEQLQEYIGHQEGHVNTIKEDRDNFAISFAVWTMHNTQAQAYQAAGITAYDLLEKYKSRPFIDTENTGNQ